MRTIKRWAHHPYLNVLVGLFMVASALWEIIDTTGLAPLGAEHGLVAVGLLHLLKAIPEAVEGAEKVAAAARAPSSPPSSKE